MTKLSPDKRDRIFAAGGTILFSILLLFLCFKLGFYFQIPPPEEQGVEVALGDSEHGFGVQASQQSQNPAQTQQSTPAVQQSQNPNTISTQSTEESISLNNKPQEKPKERQQQKPQEEAKPEPPTINQNALYGGRNTGTEQGSGQGDTEGNTNRGNPGGDPNSTRYDGVPGQGGVSFNLKGRSSSNLAKPTYSSKDQGTVVVKIWVDRQGNVIKAQAGERGTTATDRRLYDMAEQAAMKSTFSPDPNASDMQIGTITYKFIIGGM